MAKLTIMYTNGNAKENELDTDICMTFVMPDEHDIGIIHHNIYHAMLALGYTEDTVEKYFGNTDNDFNFD